MKPMCKRLSALECRTPPGTGRWHRIIQDVGQSFEDARMHYEAQNSLIAENDNLIVQKIVTP